jgi:4-amino-4-deoxy-L-arabinose transferase-like glycosyltransferase
MAMTKDKFNWKFCLCCGLSIWFVINLLQGIFTEIQEDEAYYAIYGEHLTWGYFDHPPMVGLMTFLSSIFFSGTLGVRCFTIITSCLSLFVIWLIAINRPFDKAKDLDPKNILLFFIIAVSIVMFNIYGFITTPDAALILFSALFLFVYLRYLNKNSWKNALLMGVFMALMVYSKYHAFLLLGLIVLSNLKLLKDGKFYVACILAIALLTPHILWQINADFPSFRYHLSGRNEAFRWSYFFEYLPNQLLIFNPFTFGAVVYVLFKHKPWIASSCLLAMTHKPNAYNPQKEGSDVIASEAKQSRERTPQEVFERGLCFVIIGFFFFFWLMTFRGHVEPHWTIVCVIPIVVLIYRKSLTDDKLRKYTKFFILPSLLLVLVFRILLLTPLADRYGYHGKEKYYKAVEQVADECPVVFRGSFQQPALYHYFTGKESSTLQSYYDRMTQYDLWQFDKAWIGKPVFVCGPVNGRSKTYQVDDMEIEGFLTYDFSSANRLVTTFDITNAGNDKMPVFHHGDTIRVDFSIYNPCEAPIDFHHKDFSMVVKAHYLPGDAFSFCFYKDFGIIEGQTSYHGLFYTIVNDEIGLGEHVFNLGIGDRVSSFVTEESGVKIRIEP